MLYLTMNQIRSYNPCHKGWTNLLKKAKESGLSYPEDGDIPISMSTLLDWCPLNDVTWAFRCNWTEGKELYVKFAKNCAKRAKVYAAAYADAAYADAADADAADAAAAYADAADAYAADADADAYAYADAAAAYAADAAAYAAYAAYAANAYAADAAAYAAYAAYAANAANAAYAKEKSYQKTSLKALLRNHKG